jgi:ArsR family transcriptional regulator
MAPKLLADLPGPACCPEGLGRPVPREQAVELAALYKALADPARLQLLSLLADAESGQLCACDLTEPLGLTQPTVSHHLKVLTSAGLITRAQRGTWAWFRIVPERFAELGAVLSDLGRVADGLPRSGGNPSGEAP